ncbi:MAG: alpha/beta fold hydrolase [Burkholderiales bacterium]|nr:alpha/beta fold hydrolase [Burkholderiales bacterium]
MGWRRVLSGVGLAVLVGTLPACGGAEATASGAPGAGTPGLTPQEGQCRAAGWQRTVLSAGGLERPVLWKLPAGWRGEAVLVMHGGGGSYTNFCVANAAEIAAQPKFSELALARGLAVFLLDSHDQVTDRLGRVCGKVWDDEVRARDNLDLPYIDVVLRELVPGLRPAGGRTDTFLVGHSSGGYMAVRAASRFADRVTAVAPVASGDPYGWTRDCTRRAGDRANVAGAGYDNDTGRQITEPGACAAVRFANEQPWDTAPGTRRPGFRVFHHANDGINDLSCTERVRTQLVAHGFAETAPFTLQGGARSAALHYWLDEYNAPIVEFLLGWQR